MQENEKKAIYNRVMENISKDVKRMLNEENIKSIDRTNSEVKERDFNGILNFLFKLSYKKDNNDYRKGVIVETSSLDLSFAVASYVRAFRIMYTESTLTGAYLARLIRYTSIEMLANKLVENSDVKYCFVVLRSTASTETKNKIFQLLCNAVDG